jgi:hypothetical protein
MRSSATVRIAIGAGAVMMATATASAAQAQDFFSALFGGFRAPQPSYAPVDRALPYASEGGYSPAPRVARPSVRSYSGGGQAYCVRSCDGRYFPIGGTGGESKAATCSSLCPSSETKVVYGSNIDGAHTSDGKPYSELPNAFKYRTEIVAGCTCNGKDAFGLARISIDDDPTIRKGDIVADKDGLKVAGPTRRDGEVAFSPAPAKIRAAYQKLPVVALD